MTSAERKAILIESAKASSEGRLRVVRSDPGDGLPVVIETETGGGFQGDEFEAELRELVMLGVFYEETDGVFRLETFRPISGSDH